MNKETLALYPSSFELSYEQLEEMLKLQQQANAVMIKGDEDTPYYRASVVESVEAIQHFGYKWWKATESDIGQTKMELIDILHFALSDFLKEPSNNDLVYDALELARSLAEPVVIYPIGSLLHDKTYLDNRSTLAAMRVGDCIIHQLYSLDLLTFNDLVEQLIFVSLKDGKTSFPHLYLLFEKLDMVPIEVHGLYVGKNTLNKFRMANGQKENTYYKTWDGREDNEHLTDFILQSADKGEKLTAKTVYNFLAATYSNCELS